MVVEKFMESPNEKSYAVRRSRTRLNEGLGNRGVPFFCVEERKLVKNKYYGKNKKANR